MSRINSIDIRIKLDTTKGEIDIHASNPEKSITRNLIDALVELGGHYQATVVDVCKEVLYKLDK